MNEINVYVSDYELFDLYVKAGDFKSGGTAYVYDKEDMCWYECRIKMLMSYFVCEEKDYSCDDIDDMFYELTNSCGYSGEFILDDICYYVCVDYGRKLKDEPDLNVIGYC